ncbi:hypothetical protein V6N12_070957 [Hibiscus sabdariffa]|uniref:Uncharacterized protein n=1 Tax=Hibiscus sabdariffa TaxID=183260 RepID=A0ABR2FIN2_9ROSI
MPSSKQRRSLGIVFSSSEYATQCLNLIAHFETSTSTRRGTTPSIHRFHFHTYKMDCPCAINHLDLVTYGVPSIIASSASSALTAVVAEFYYWHYGFLDTQYGL